ncbi:MAG: hypothetical protein RLZZ324_1138 [Candidatus Parcubacteria bacterium]|jgi:predicted CoA-binding protein
MTDEAFRDIFEGTKVIASVGLSSNPLRPAGGVCAYLQAHGYRIIPVNPRETEVLGEKAYPDLAAVAAAGIHPDVVQIFRRPDAVPDVTRDAIAIGAKVVWMQDGAGNTEAARMAEEAGLTAVVDDCMARVHRRLFA